MHSLTSPQTQFWWVIYGYLWTSMGHRYYITWSCSWGLRYVDLMSYQVTYIWEVQKWTLKSHVFQWDWIISSKFWHYYELYCRFKIEHNREALRTIIKSQNPRPNGEPNELAVTRDIDNCGTRATLTRGVSQWQHALARPLPLREPGYGGPWILRKLL